MLIVGMVLLTGGARLLKGARPANAAEKDAIAAPR